MRPVDIFGEPRPQSLSLHDAGFSVQVIGEPPAHRGRQPSEAGCVPESDQTFALKSEMKPDYTARSIDIYWVVRAICLLIAFHHPSGPRGHPQLNGIADGP
jgi:hypothetical protein